MQNRDPYSSYHFLSAMFKSSIQIPPLMVNTENLTKRKLTGGRRKAYRGRRRRESKRLPKEPVVDKQVVQNRRIKGGAYQDFLVQAATINVATVDNKVQKAKITAFISNQANRDYERRGIVTKGSILNTEIGKVRVTSKPSSTGSLNGVVVK